MRAPKIWSHITSCRACDELFCAWSPEQKFCPYCAEAYDPQSPYVNNPDGGECYDE